MNHHNHRESRTENQFIYVPIRHLYICREASTNQLLFMQNKPNFRKSQMNVKSYNTKDYENKRDWTLGENKPNSNPIKPNFRKAQMNVSSLITKDYRKKDDFSVRINKPNSNPIKPNFTYPQRGKTEVRCRFSEFRYLSSAFCFLSNGPHDCNRLRLQWHFRVQKTSQKQDFVFQVCCQLYRYP